MPRLVSQRKKVTPPGQLTEERWKFLGLDEAQPNLGLAPTNNEGYTLQSDATGKQTYSNTLGKLSFSNSTVTNTQQADIVIDNRGNGNIVLSPQTKLQINGNTNIEGNIVVTGDNPLGTAPVINNVLYVNENGDDANDGRAMDPSRAKRTISGAVKSPYYQEGTTIRVASGHYWEDNPIPLKASTCVIGDDLRTTFIEPLNKEVDLFWVNSGVYIAQMAMLNLKKGSVTRYAPGGAGTYTTGAYCTAFPPSLTAPIRVQYSPYIQNCTNQSGPWLFDGTMFRPNQTVQVPLGAGVGSFTEGVNTFTVVMSTGSIALGMAVNDLANPGYANAQQLLIDNIPFLQAEALAYISATYPTFEYDQTTCARDVGLIINAVAKDAAFGGNLRSRDAGAAYWSGTYSIINNEQTQTIGAINHLASLASKIIINEISTSTYQTATVQVTNLSLTGGEIVANNLTNSFDTITTVIAGGLSALPAPVDMTLGLYTISGLSADDITQSSTVTNICSTLTNLANAQTLLQDNRSFIQSEVVAWVNHNYPSLVYDESLCFRDVGLIVDAVSIDGIIGGNIQSVIAGTSYWEGNVSNIPGEIVQTVGAINYINTLSQLIITNTPVTRLSTATQVIHSSLTGGGDASEGIAKSIGIITNIITNGVLAAPAQEYPSLDQYVVTLNSSPVANGTSSTIYFGYTTVYPVQDKDIPEEWVLARALNPQGSGGGALVDGNAPAPNSPIQSFVFDAFTQLNQGGIGVHILNNGYAQLVSVFTIFCDIGVLTENGGIASITNSNANFGNYALVSKGYGRLDFSGIVWNPAYPTNVANGQYYPLGYWPDSVGSVEVYIPDLVNRPHIGLIMEVVPPATYIDYTGNRVPYVNSQGYPGFLGATPNTSTITAGSYSIPSINTDGIVVGHTLYVTDENGNDGIDGVPYVNIGTTVVDINFNSVTLDQPINLTEGDPTNDLYFNLFFCGNAYYSVLSSSVDTTVPVTSTESMVPDQQVETAEAIRYAGEVVSYVVQNLPLPNPYQTGTVQSINLSYTDGAHAEPGLTNSFNIIANIVENGQLAAPPVVQNSSLKTQDQGILNAAKLIYENEKFIQEEVVAYVDKEIFGFTYDHDKCYRDTGLIVDAVAFDTLYGGYSQSGFAGLQYWNQQGYTGNIPKEITTTTEAINYVSLLAQQILANNTSGTRYQNTVSQITTSSSISTTTIAAVANDFFVITTILTSGTAGVTDLIIPNGIASTSTDIINAYNLLQANKTYLQTEAVAWVNQNINGAYDEALCYRDTGLIVDALVQDLIFGGTSQSTFAGIQYWSQGGYTGNIPEEISTTTAAISYAQTLAQQVVTHTTGTRYQSTVTQVTNLPAATSAEATTIANNFNVILNILSSGTVGVTDLIIPNGIVASTSSHVTNAYALLEANKAFIQTEVLAYITSQHPGFSYSQSLCYRDVGYIIDSVSIDLLYGGNRQAVQSGTYYYGYDTTTVLSNEIPQVTASYNYISKLVPYIVQGISTTTYQNTVTQITNLTTGTAAEVITIQRNLSTITNIITNGPSVAADASPLPITATSTASVLHAATILNANRAFIQAEVIAYANSQFLPFTYNSTLCNRDTGLIVDAIVLDILYPTAHNSQSTFAGLQYWNQSTNTNAIIPGELTTTTNAIIYVKELAEKVILNDVSGTRYQTTVTQVTNLLPATQSEVNFLETDFNVVLGILANGTAGVTDTIVPNNPTPSTVNSINNAYALLQANRNYILTEAIAYVNSNATSGYSYNQATCFRDTGYILDSISFDLLHGGNRQAVQSGVSYYGYTNVSAIPNESTQTVAAYAFINSLTQTLVEGGSYTPLQTTVAPVTNLTTSTAAQASAIAKIISTVTNIITNGTGTALLTPISLTRTTDQTAEAAANILQANRAFIQAETIAWVDQAFNYTYDQATCYRDVGYIIDSISFDLLHGGNRQAVQSAVSYYNPSTTESAIEGQRIETQYAYQHISNMLGQILNGQVVTPTYQTTATQNTNTVSVSLAEIVTVQDKINTITNIILNGPSVAPYPSPISLTPSTSTDAINAFNAIEANRAFIQAEVNAYIDSTFTSFQYNSVKCARDTGLIVDSIAVDLLYPGSTQSTFAGLQYWNQDTGYTGSISKELTTTTAAINYVSQLAQEVIQGVTTGTRYQNTVTQISNLPAGSTSSVAKVASEFGLITQIFTSGTSGVTDLIVPNGSVSTDIGIEHAYALLQANRNYIQTEAIAFVEATKTGPFEYNADNCTRDTGLIIDSLAFDLLYGGTSQSTFAGLQYWSQTTSTSAVIPNEFNTTTAAISYVQGLTAAFANTAGGTIPEGIVNKNFNTILNILNSGTVGVTNLIVPNGSPSTATYIVNAYNAIISNISTIQNMTLAYIASTYPTFSYNTATCARDVGYILNSVAFDLLHGGNRQSIMSAVYYYGYNTATILVNEMPQSIAAYDFIKTLVSDIVTGTLITTNRQTEVKQITSLGFSFTPAQQAKCSRDTGLIVDALSYDMLYPTANNSQSTFAGLQYWNQNGYTGFIASEITTTTNAINYLKTLAQRVMTDDTTGIRYQSTVTQVPNSTIASSTDTAFVANEFNLILSILNTGTSGITDLIVPNGTASTTTSTVAGYNLLQANRSYLQAEVVAYVEATKTANFNYDRAICGRDVGYIVDSISFDLLHGGNRQAVQSGVYYYGFSSTSSVLINEYTQTTGAYEHLREVVGLIVQNQAVTPSASNTATQVFESYAATSVEETEVQSLVDNILNIISVGPSAATGDMTPISLVASTSTNVQRAFNLLQANRSFIQSEITSFVNDNYAGTTDVIANVGTTTDVSIISNNIDLITNIIANGPSVAPSQVPIGQVASTSTSTLSAYSLLLKNKEFIKAEVIAYIDQEFASGPYYNRDTCRRDTRLIVDALAQDLLFDGSSQSNFAGLQYWSQDLGYTGSIASEITTTTNAVNYISSLAQKVVLGDTTGDRFQSLIAQQTNYPLATQAEADLIAADFTVITNILINGVAGVTDAIVPNSLTASTNTNVQNAYALLQANVAYLQAEAIAFIEDTKTAGFTYNSDTCYRDVGYMINSVSFDLLYGGNRQAIQSGVAYYAYDGDISVIEDEQTLTTAAYDRMNAIIPQIITGQLVTNTYQNHTKQVLSTNIGTTAQATAISSNVALITNIINNGPSVAIAKTPIGLTASTDPNVINSANLLELNKEFIVEEVIAYVNATYSGFQYDQATCFRDVGYMLDSVSFDLLHGGNRQAIQAGTYYYNFDGNSSAIPGEMPQTTAAYNFISGLMAKVITANTVTSVYQTGTVQVTNLPGTTSTAMANSINTNIELITNIINNGPGVAPSKTSIPLVASSDPNATKAYNLLEANRAFIVAETIAYINKTFVNFSYNRNKCYRDVGSIIDAVVFDQLFPGNYRSVNVGNGYYARQGRYHIVNLEEAPTNPLLFIDGTTVNFYQRSYQSASGYLFEYIGSGPNYSALPQIGRKDPIQSHETVQLNNGKVFFTSTDQNGDFRIGTGLVISQATGVLYGRTFQKSLYAEMTPFILVVGGQ